MSIKRFIVSLLQDILVLYVITEGKKVPFKPVHVLLLQLSSTAGYVPFYLRHSRNGL